MDFQGIKTIFALTKYLLGTMSKPIISKGELDNAIALIREHTKLIPSVGLILGSGLGPFADQIEDAVTIPTAIIPHYPVSTVAGHAGELIIGNLAGKHVIALKGRIHSYEGYSLSRITFPIHLLAALGVQKIIVTNAAGGLNRNFKAGDLMLIEDHVNLMFSNPLIGINDESVGPRFPDMSRPYDPGMLDIAEQAGRDLGIALRKGVLGALPGPTYESAAEVRMMQRFGVDAGTMSTVPEVIAAVYRGLAVLGISCITNLGTGMSQNKLSHDEVTEVANLVKDRFSRLIKEIVARI